MLMISLSVKDYYNNYYNDNNYKSYNDFIDHLFKGKINLKNFVKTFSQKDAKEKI